MLYPSLKELIRLRSFVSNAGVATERANNRNHGDYTSLFHGLGVEFETVRPYVVGDDVRYIDWRVTARIGKPQVKTFRAECDRNVIVVLDANAYMRFGTKSTFKSVQAARVAALISWKSLQLQDRIGAFVFGDIAKGMQYFQPSKSDTSILRMLKVLCSEQINQHPPVSIASALRQVSKVITPQSLVFIIADFSCDDMQELESAILAIRKRSTVVLLPVHDPADSDIPAIGQLIVQNGTESAVINTDDLAARQRYQAEWHSYFDKITQFSKKISSPLVWIETASDPVKSLFASGSIRAWKT